MNRKVIVSEDTETALWWRLSHFKNPDRVSGLIRQAFSTASQQNAEKQAKQIRYCLEQAEEYFKSAEVATLATKPLLLYYGMASLAWALILFKKPGEYAFDNINAQHQSHGLERPGLDYGIRNLLIEELLTRIRISLSNPIQGEQNGIELRGTFGLLYSVARLEPVGVKYVRMNGDITETRTQLFTTVPERTTAESLVSSALSLRQLLLDIPDMSPSLAELGMMPLFARVTDQKVMVHADGSHKLTVLTAGCTAEMNATLRSNAKRCERVSVSDVGNGLRLEATWDKEDDKIRLPSMHETLDGRLHVYILQDLEPLPETSALLAIMFIFGMVVRYYPHIWMHWLERRHPIVEVVEAFLPIVRRKYPNLILNNLTGDSFIFKRDGSSYS